MSENKEVKVLASHWRYKMLISAGSKIIQGGYHRSVASAGELKIYDASVTNLKAAGSTNIENSKVETAYLAGEATLKSSTFKDLTIAGEAKLMGVNQCELFSLTGEAYCENLKTNVFHYGMKKLRVHSVYPLRMRGSVKAITFQNFTKSRLDYDFSFKNILSNQPICYHGELQCDRIISFAELDVDTINAEYVFIRPTFGVKVNNLTGSKIVVDPIFNDMDEWNKIDKRVSLDELKNNVDRIRTIRINEMEGDDLELDYVDANKVSGDRIVIHEHCRIKVVEYRQTIDISDKAMVGKVVKI